MLLWTIVTISRVKYDHTSNYLFCCWGSAPEYIIACVSSSLLWRHNGGECVSNHQPHDCLLNRLFGRWSKKTSKPRVAGLCAGNSPETGEFPAQMASNAENVSIWWRHHVRLEYSRGTRTKSFCWSPGPLYIYIYIKLTYVFHEAHPFIIRWCAI